MIGIRSECVFQFEPLFIWRFTHSLICFPHDDPSFVSLYKE